MTTIDQPRPIGFGPQTGFELRKRTKKGWNRQSRREAYARAKGQLAAFGNDREVKLAFRRLTKAVRRYVSSELSDASDLRNWADGYDRKPQVERTLKLMSQLAEQIGRLDTQGRILLGQELADSYRHRHPDGRLVASQFFATAPAIIADLIAAGEQRALAKPKIGHRPSMDVAKALASDIVDAWLGLGHELAYRKSGIVAFADAALRQIKVEGRVELTQLGEPSFMMKPLNRGREKVYEIAFPATGKDVTTILGWVRDEVYRRKAKSKMDQLIV